MLQARMQSLGGYKLKDERKVETALIRWQITHDTYSYQQIREKLSPWYDISISFGEDCLEK